jgi:hypothetical protein
MVESWSLLCPPWFRSVIGWTGDDELIHAVLNIFSDPHGIGWHRKHDPSCTK